MNEIIISLLTLITLELILGIDNIIFISILADKLPVAQRNKLRYLGLGLAVVLRLALLAGISWILKLDNTLFEIGNMPISGKGLILITGGLFLIYKSTREIYLKTEIANEGLNNKKPKESFKNLLLQVIVLDLVFSVDSIITAVGMVKELWVMYVAVIVSVCIMLLAARPISEFIQKHPSFKILALSFLILIGIALVAEGLHFEIPKAYIYCSIGFSLIVNIIQVQTNTLKNLNH
jgi:predicted tellurium resistance membrane protein TerC